jgi:hypothetical protein
VEREARGNAHEKKGRRAGEDKRYRVKHDRYRALYTQDGDTRESLNKPRKLKSRRVQNAGERYAGAVTRERKAIMERQKVAKKKKGYNTVSQEIVTWLLCPFCHRGIESLLFLFCWCTSSRLAHIYASSQTVLSTAIGL